MKRTIEYFTDYLDAMSAVGTAAGASRAAGIDSVTALRWTKLSRDHAKTKNPEESEFHFSYRGSEGWFHDHVRDVQKALVQDILEGAMIRARDGAATVAMLDGQIVYQLNPEFDPRTPGIQDLDEETLRLCGYATRFLYDEKGKKIPSVVRSAPSNELALSMLAGFSKRFAKRLSVEHQHQVSGGVMVVGAPQREALLGGQAIDPVSEAITDMTVTDGEFTEVEAKSDEPAAPEPEQRSLTPLQKDLIDKARAKGLPI